MIATARRRRWLGGAAFAVLTVAGCSSSTTTSPPPEPTTEATTTTAGPAPTTATTTPAPSTVPAPTATATPAAVAPLTGLPVADPAILGRPAMAIKIDNQTEARPQAGLNQADIVYEEIVEGITRFFAIFHSTDAAPVGPIRSARTTDGNLLNQLNRPFLVWSGGNAKVVQAGSAANAESRAHGQTDGFYRDAERRKRTKVEHTLFLDSTATIWATATPEQGPPNPFFTYRPAGSTPSGDPVSELDLRLSGVDVAWEWDAASGTYLRSEYGEAHTDAAGQRISAANVVVQFVQYKASAADPKSPEAITVQNTPGDAVVATGGTLILAHWERTDPSKPAVLLTADGSPVELTPGRTWIELADQYDSQLTTR